MKMTKPRMIAYKVTKFLKCFSIRNGIKRFSSLYSSININVCTIKEKLNDLYSTNFSLGLYHLENGRFADAILRFNIIRIFIRPKDMESNYMLGWIYLMKNSLKTSLKYFGLSNDIRFADMQHYIKNISNMKNVPENIWNQHRYFVVQHYVNKFITKNVNVFDFATSLALKHYRSKEYTTSILDLMCGVGVIGGYIVKKFKSFSLTGTDTSDDFLNLVDSQKQEYSSLLNMDTETAFTHIKDAGKRYDIVFAIDAFTIHSNLDRHINQICDIIHDEGIFIFGVFVANKSKISENNMHFMHDISALESPCINAGLLVVSKELIKLNYAQYLLFVCRKNRKH